MTAQLGSGNYFSFGGCELDGSLAAGNLGYDANLFEMVLSILPAASNKLHFLVFLFK
jgi:hypothetical protein